MIGEDILSEKMIEEECYTMIIELFENNKVLLASFILNYFTREIMNKEVLKNCLIIILHYLQKDVTWELEKKTQGVHQLNKHDKKRVNIVLKDEFFLN